MTLDPGTLYEALRADATRLRRLHRLQYRCASRCLLLDAVEVGDTVLLHQRRFKNSHDVNQRRSSEAGRLKNTTDGDRHWLPRTFYVEQSALAHPEDLPVPQLGLDCDHVGEIAGGGQATLAAPDFWTDWHARHADVTVRADGTRYVVR